MKKSLLLPLALILILQSCSKDIPEIKLIDFTLNETEVHLNPEDSFQLIATFNPQEASNKELTWISSDEKIATVSSDGQVTAIKIGEAVITASNLKYAKSANSKIIVKPLPIREIILASNALSLDVGSKQTISIKSIPDEAPQTGLKWVSSDPYIAFVTSKGEINGIRAGQAIITVTTAEGNVSASLTVTVRPVLAESITLNKGGFTMKEGLTEKLTAVIVPSNVTDRSLNWSSSNDKIATVGDDGVITAIAEGETVITARSADGKVSAFLKLIVVPRFAVLDKSYDTTDGMTVTLTTFGVTRDHYGTYSYYIGYTLKNNTKQAIYENIFQMYHVNKNETQVQTGFFTKLFPGDTISRAYTFRSTEELGILEYGAAFFTDIPKEERLQWLAPKIP